MHDTQTSNTASLITRRALLGGALAASISRSAGAFAAPATPVTGRIDAALAEVMRRFVDDGAFAGAALVAQGDSVLLRAGYGIASQISGEVNSPETAYQIASLTKAFTATAVMQLALGGVLSLDDPIEMYLPEVVHTGRDGVQATIRHLLTHTAGVPDFFTIYDAGNPLSYPLSSEQLLADVDARELEFTPGTEQRYSNSGYTYAGLIVERVSGLGFEAYLKANILEPAGMTTTYILEPPDPAPPVAKGYGVINGTEIAISDFSRIELVAAAGGLTSTVDDLLRWSRALDAGTIIPAAALAAMETPVLGGYGMGWEWSRLGGRVAVGHEGTSLGFRTKLARFPDDDVVIVLLGNKLDAEVTEIADALAATLFRDNS